MHSGMDVLHTLAAELDSNVSWCCTWVWITLGKRQCSLVTQKGWPLEVTPGECFHRRTNFIFGIRAKESKTLEKYVNFLCRIKYFSSWTVSKNLRFSRPSNKNFFLQSLGFRLSIFVFIFIVLFFVVRCYLLHMLDWS